MDGTKKAFNVGFTGSRKGLTDYQRDCVRERLAHWVAMHPVIVLRHGDSLKADAQAHDMALLMGYATASHPSTIDKHRAFCVADCIHPPRDPLLRNQDIVSGCSELIAAPATRFEIRRSGTWSTIRYARRVRRPIYLVYPDRVEYEA
jgi:hypothetical protein